jgi:hypothetical protein
MWTPGNLVKFRVVLYKQPSKMYGQKNALRTPKNDDGNGNAKSERYTK